MKVGVVVEVFQQSATTSGFLPPTQLSPMTNKLLVYKYKEEKHSF